jgi:L-threonine-O-3-phosphate decarboxylase
MRQPAHGGNLVWAAALAGCSPSAILDFSASISPLGPPNAAIAAIVSQLDNLRYYPDPNYSALRLALAQFHQLSPEWILPGNGSAELLSLAGRELAQLSAAALITPAFGDYYRALAAHNAKVLEFPLNFGVAAAKGKMSSFVVCLPPSLSSLSHHSPKSGLLLNNPHNPTGTLFTRSAILPYLKEFALVVVDEAFMDFLPEDQEQSLIKFVQEYPNLVILRSLTKFYSLPGLRLGYAISHPDRLRQWQLWRDPWPVNTLAAAAAIAAVEDREFQEQTWLWLPQARNELFESLASLSGLQPFHSAANFLLVKSQTSSSQLQQQLLKHHQILIRDCLSFPELGDRYFRIAVRSKSDNQRLLEAISLVIGQ